MVKVHLAVEKFSVIKDIQAIQDANVVLLTIDARENISDQDLSTWLYLKCRSLARDRRK